MAKLTDHRLNAQIRDVSSWAPDADLALVEECVRCAWGIMDVDPYGIAPIAFVVAMLRLGFMVDGLDAVLRITEHLVASMADWNPVEDGAVEAGGQYHA